MKIPLKKLHDQVVVVFGASSGIGRLTALRLAKKGAKVIVSARDGPALEEVVAEIRAAGGQAFAIAAEVSDFEQVEAVAKAAVDHFGRLDTWIHTAANLLMAPFEKITPAEFKHTIEVNLIGQAYGAMAALPHLRKAGGGALIHISSLEARQPMPWHTAYAASKHGMPGFLNSLRMEFMHEKIPISVTEILPSSINTPITSGVLSKVGYAAKSPPLIYEPDVVVDCIEYACEHPVRQLVAGAAGKSLIWGHAVFPALTEAIILPFVFPLLHSDEPKGECDPNSFWQPCADNRISADWPGRKFSLGTWLDLHPGLKWSLSGALASFAAFAIWRKCR